MAPYCDALRSNPLQLTCRQDKRAVAVCNLQKFPEQLPPEYQVQSVTKSWDEVCGFPPPQAPLSSSVHFSCCFAQKWEKKGYRVSRLETVVCNITKTSFPCIDLVQHLQYLKVTKLKDPTHLPSTVQCFKSHQHNFVCTLSTFLLFTVQHQAVLLVLNWVQQRGQSQLDALGATDSRKLYVMDGPVL